MRELLQAIQTRFDADLSLGATFPEGCYLERAPDKSEPPTCVVSIASGTVNENTCPASYEEYALVRFAVYHTKARLALDNAYEIDEVFHDAALPLTGNAALVSIKRTAHPVIRAIDEKTWAATWSYDVWVHFE
jgi:hypothetical protein